MRQKLPLEETLRKLVEQDHGLEAVLITLTRLYCPQEEARDYQQQLRLDLERLLANCQARYERRTPDGD